MAYYIESDLPPKAYCALLRQHFQFPIAIFPRERVTGVMLGPFFSIAYHSPYEWNRRITSECNRAFGRVLTVDGRTQVQFVCSKGQFSPFWLLVCFLLGLLIFRAFRFAPVWQVLASAVFSLVLCGYTAFVDSLTDAGAQGADVLTDLLREPDQFYYC